MASRTTIKKALDKIEEHTKEKECQVTGWCLSLDIPDRPVMEDVFSDEFMLSRGFTPSKCKTPNGFKMIEDDYLEYLTEEKLYPEKVPDSL